MTSVDDYTVWIGTLIAPALEPRVESVALDDALDRVTAHDVLSPVDLPLFRNSQMDGYAVRAADLPATLPIVGEVAARPSDPPPLGPGTTVKIMTGAVIPEGADAIVPVERTTVSGVEVTFTTSPAVGEYVRDRGSDTQAGDELLRAGVRLQPRHLAVLAAAGIATVQVRRRVRVAVITTGSELLQPGGTPALGQVFDSNGTALAAAVTAAGAVVGYRAHVGDEAGELEVALRAAASSADLIVTSGGISMGDYEVVRDVLEPLGGRIGHVAMQPGGPQASGIFQGVPVVAFPGNPVSTQLSFEVFVAPLLREVAALPPALQRERVLSAPLVSVVGKRQFLRGRAIGENGVDVVSGPGSHLVAGLAAADLFVIVPEHVTELAAGSSVQTWAL